VLNVQIQRPYRRAFHEALPEMLAAPRDISIWHPVRTDEKAGSSVDEPPGEPG
jgi:quinol monooxygenase YgiN